MNVTSETIRAALRQRYPTAQGEYALLFEVSDATGARNTRAADAVVMSCWPSRGLDLHGMEIKVSRGDWLRERQQPAKAETIAAYCDFWWLITGPGVVLDVGEVPTAWGWAEYRPASVDLADKRTPARLVTIREPTRTPAKSADRLFLASVLRNAGRLGDGAEKAMRNTIHAELDAVQQERINQEVTRRMGEAGRLREAVLEFERETGISLSSADQWDVLKGEDGRQIGAMVSALRKSGLHRDYQGLASLGAQLDATRALISEAAAGLGLTLERPKVKKRR